ncbi:MAG: DUF4012 domain-containing protein [Candidatus Gottesmanbacteria bacterium]|nr:DUF4012 domain-containing protein [Candidatus Gottesmanbacteria bacterium]
MHSAATSVATGEHTALPIARIDAQDEPSVLPLREYLGTHGVQVFVNRASVPDATYHLVMGDSEFVKDIVFRTKKQGEKRLAIVVGHPQGVPDLTDYRGKIIRVDPKEISATQVIEMFEFFFTSEKDVLDLRSPRLNRIVHEKPFVESPVPEPPAQSPPLAAGDRERIGNIIKDVFGDHAKPPPRRRKKRRQWMIGVLIGVGILIIPVVWYLVSIAVSGAALAASARAIAAGNIGAAGWQSRVARYWIGQGGVVVHVAAVPLRWAGVEDSIRGQERLVSFFLDAADASENIQSMMGVSQSVASGFLNQMDVTGTGTTPAADITKLRRSLDSVQNTLGLAEAELTLLLRDRTFPFTIPGVWREGTRIISQISTLRGFASNMDELVSLFLQLAGFKDPRTYLILLQNSTELRPTGGFIGSVAVASFADGRMTDLAVQDVYTYDGQLKGHVDPPIPVRELLGEEHWYLRDSNWDPDFAASAARAAWFYQKESGTSVDGVLAINTPFIVEVLKATGPIDLPDYNDRVTGDNFYGRSLYYTQNDFFAGSTQKKDFLGTLARALITKITTSRTTNIPALFNAVTTALSGHDVLLMFGNQDLESVVAHYGWAGRVPSTTGCIGEGQGSCSFDPLITVEANMGVNKVNYFVSRIVDRQVTVSAGGTISETILETIKNASTQDQNLPYRVYLRLLLPPDVDVAGVKLDAVQVVPRKDTAKAPTIPVLPYLERTDVTSASYVLGIGMDIPAGHEKQLSITYTRNNIVSFGTSGAVVDLFVQKQPGVTGTPVHTVVRYPPQWTAGIEEQASGTGGQDFIANTGQLEYNMVLNEDRLTRIRFTK